MFSQFFGKKFHNVWGFLDWYLVIKELQLFFVDGLSNKRNAFKVMEILWK